MRSQVQVLAGPPRFSQLRAPTRLGRWRSLLAWAAPGPRALRTVEPRDLPERATRGPGRSQRAPIVVATGSAQVMVGLMPASMALTTCGAMPQMGCTARGRCSSTDGRSWRATGVYLAGQAIEPGLLPERLPRRRPGPARRRRWPARPAPALRPGSGSGSCPSRSRIWQGGQSQAPPDVWPSAAPRSHPMRTPRTPTRNARTPNVHTRTPGHRTPDTGRGCGQGDKGTAGIRTSGAHHAERPRAGTPNRVPVDGARSARQPMAARR
jgi:hypothetical protein